MSLSRNAQSGFTLLEFMVALIVLGIALVFVLPNVHGTLRGTQIDRVPSELQSDVRFALSVARSQGRTLRIVFREDGYSIRELADSTRVLQTRSFGDTTQLTGSGNPRVFPWGIVEQTRVHVQSSDDRYYNLTLLPTGRVASQNES